MSVCLLIVASESDELHAIDSKANKIIARTDVGISEDSQCASRPLKIHKEANDERVRCTKFSALLLLWFFGNM